MLGASVSNTQSSLLKELPSDGYARQWIVVLIFLAACLILQSQYTWLKAYPDYLELAISDWINWVMDWFVAFARPLFRLLAWLLGFPLDWVREFLQVLPWPAFILIAALVSLRAGGWKLAAFTTLSLTYMLIIGYWEESMNSLALVAISVPLAVSIGFVIGVYGFISNRAERAIMPMLDVMQTIPAFAYLLPILILFGFGPVVGLIASVLFSFSPMVRNTIVGLRNVAPEIIESGLMSGAKPGQLFWQVRVPTASRQLLLGVNQTTMASLSMVVVASIIGGTNDIGWEVLSTMRKAQFGESLLAGIVIALIAMILDRITWGFAENSSDEVKGESWLYRYRYFIFAAVGTLVIVGISRLVPTMIEYPNNWVVSPAGAMNDSINWVVANYQPVIKEFKRVILFFIMLPLKIGLDQTVTPYTWGFAWTPIHTAVYFTLVLAAAFFAMRRISFTVAITIVTFGMIIFNGLTEMPWPTLPVVFVMLAYQLGGPRLALGTFAGLAFLLLSGSWEKTMLSVYLCGIAVMISFAGGASLGIWAAHNRRVSQIMRPVNDSLQTMPLFVILIPIVMIFKIGEFTALFAIIAYAYVPAFRYAEHGIRSVPEEVVEAARSMGCTPSQLLWQVKLPLAVPNIMLGLNQTIMYAIAMLVIAALVGTSGLGQQVYIGLSKGDVGIGLVAGAGMAIIAIIADRMCQAARRKFEERVSN